MSAIGEDRQSVGRSGEALACRFLERTGYRIEARNWRCKLGEIDIVARKGAELVIVEVRTRRDTARFGTPAESVDARKQARLRRIAQAYLLAHGWPDEAAVRFDVMDIRWPAKDGQPQIRHHEAAF